MSRRFCGCEALCRLFGIRKGMGPAVSISMLNALLEAKSMMIVLWSDVLRSLNARRWRAII